MKELGYPITWVLVLLLGTIGCNHQTSVPLVVHGMNVNGYEFDYELAEPSSIEADSASLRISSGKHRIEVVKGKLRVDDRPYGNVKTKDRISVVGGQVSVNGETRKPDV